MNKVSQSLNSENLIQFTAEEGYFEFIAETSLDRVDNNLCNSMVTPAIDLTNSHVSIACVDNMDHQENRNSVDYEIVNLRNGSSLVYDGRGGFRHTEQQRNRPSIWSRVKRCGSLFCIGLGKWPKTRIQNENMLVLSIIQMLCGLAAIILSGVSIKNTVFLYKMATGLWSGCIMFATGIHGIVTVFRTNMCTVVSMLVWCILVSLTALLLVCVSIAGFIGDGFFSEEKLDSRNSYFSFDNFGLKYPNEKAVDQEKVPFTHDKIHQVILHILLLIVGVLEVSVGISTAVLCFQQVCPKYYSTDRSRRLCMNRSSNRNSEMMLALSTDCVEGIKGMSPAISPTAVSFLPEKGSRAILITQADTDSLGYAAAQAAAACLAEQNKSILHNESTIKVSSTGSLILPDRSRRFKRRFVDAVKVIWRNRINHLRPSSITETNTSSNVVEQIATITSSNPNVSRIHQSTVNTLLSGNQKASLIYVMPSPSKDEPPIIFPPFPPAYAQHNHEDSQTKSFSFGSSTLFAVSQLPSSEVRGESDPNDNLSLMSGNQRNSRPRSLFGPYTSMFFQPNVNPSVNSSVNISGDRILQPVLIIEDDKPPSYSSEDPN